MPRFIAAGHDGLRIVSVDGITWTNPQLGKEGETYRAAAFGNDRFVLVGSYGGSNIFASSVDGTTWKTSVKDAQYSRYARGLGFGDGRFLALGGDPGSVGAAKPFNIVSSDGETWETPVETGGKFMLRRFAYGNKLHVAVGDRGRRVHSPTGNDWKDAPAAKPIDTLVDIAFGNGVFVGVGLHGLRMSTTDGATWTEPQRGEEGDHLNTIAFTSKDFVAIGPESTYRSADGKTWERKPNKNPPQTMTHAEGIFVGLKWKGKIVRSTDGVVWTDTHTAERHLEAVTAAR